MEKMKHGRVLRSQIVLMVLILSLFMCGCSNYELGSKKYAPITKQALAYMKEKYNEDFVMKQLQGNDMIWKTSWGYEMWMYPKVKVPEEDYPSDMELYVFMRNGEFFEGDNYYKLKLSYQAWKKYKPIFNKTFEKMHFFLPDFRGDFYVKGSFEEIDGGKYPNVEICFGINIFEDVSSVEANSKIRSKIFHFIKFLQKNSKIKYSLGIGIYDEKYYNNMRTFDEGLCYKVEIFNKEYLKIEKIEDLEKYFKISK